MTVTEEPILEAVGVSKYIPLYRRGRGTVLRAVESVDLQLHRGRIVALVGESGSGKTTLARLLALGDRPSAGEIRLHGRPAGMKHRSDLTRHFSRVQLILQDPFSSLNNLHRLRYILSRPIRNFGKADRAQIETKVLDLLERVHLTPAADFIDKFPHQLSGGQRQRVAIARALAVEPEVLLGDEPVSMLDVSIRLDVLNLFAELRDRDGLAMLYITHDIASARYFSDEIDVMYASYLVEGGPAEAVTQDAKHPYTQLLLAASPDPERPATPADEVGDWADPVDLTSAPGGCPFQPRCPHALPRCLSDMPPRTDFEGGHWTRCWLYGEPGAVSEGSSARSS